MNTPRASSSGQRRGREKVAILLLSLGNELGSRLLQKFDASDLKTIMGSTSALGAVDKDDLDLLVDDFAAQFAKALGLGTDFESMRSLVEQAFSPDELNSMLGGTPLQTVEPVWQRVTGNMENTLVPYLLDEHPQTVAFILSRVSPDVAARCLSILPGDFRLTVARRLLRLQPVKDRVSAIVESCLERDLLSGGDSDIEAEGRSRLADMLNKLERAESSAILEGVAISLPEEAAKLKRMVFSFEDLAKLSQPARLALFDKVDTEQVILALRGMEQGLKEAALSSLGARARRMVEAELANDTGQKTAESEKARSSIAALVLTMAQRGELELPSADEATGA